MIHASLQFDPSCRKNEEEGASDLGTSYCIIHCNDSLLQLLLLEAATVVAAGGYGELE